MPETVTHSLILRESLEGKPLYAPFEGTRYEIARGVFVRLRLPVADLVDAFEAAVKEQETLLRQYQRDHCTDHQGEPVENPTDEQVVSVLVPQRVKLEEALKIARIVCEIEPPATWPEAGSLLYNVLVRAGHDFRDASQTILAPLPGSSALLSQLSALVSMSSRGLANGVSEATST